ncbi:hypothetical protein CONLIGDRAFT_69211 [Coniochaeta ligniaria NRRL 30616]|uniref:Uncharacterized protein n=1 Tax=Coniochaeta ligniaria NRRL 30616 TaxID=1408157 RepID=A0A1J7J6M7_9PEZI|nr:hypothetical protein CONLIGDRAFT_69211 [Coniochaeta ligniaria NRRL 30616]
MGKVVRARTPGKAKVRVRLRFRLRLRVRGLATRSDHHEALTSLLHTVILTIPMRYRGIYSHRSNRSGLSRTIDSALQQPQHPHQITFEN